MLQGIRAPGGIRAPHKIGFCFAFAIFSKKTWRREILGNGARNNFPWVFEDFRFMIHTPFSRFFLEKNTKVLMNINDVQRFPS